MKIKADDKEIIVYGYTCTFVFSGIVTDL